MSGYTEMSNMQLTQLVKKLEEEVEHLRRQLGSSGVPDPLDLENLYVKDEISVGIDSDGNYNPDATIKLYSSTGVGDADGKIYFVNLPSGTTIQLDADRIVDKSFNQIWP